MKNYAIFDNVSDYVQDIMSEFPHLEIIELDRKRVLARSKGGKAHFFYSVSDDISFHFNLVCECREADRKWFERAVKRNGYKLESAETATDYFEVLQKA